MARIVKRTLVTLGIAVAVVVLAVGGLIAWTFSGRMPILDGEEVGPARIVKDGFVSVAVIATGEHEVALVDAGNDASAAAILADLARRGMGPEAVKTILLTHGHRDHIAGIPMFPGAEVVVLAGDSDLVQGRAGGKGPLTRLMPVHPTGLRATKTVNDGDTIAIGRLSARAYAVPGHTSGSAAWLIDGVLFLGDSADADSDGRLAGAPWLFSDDGDQNRASLASLATRLASEGTEVRALVFAHSGALTRGLEPLAEFAHTH